MMGKKIRSFAPLSTNLSLEELVPKENFYRRLDQRLDLSFVRELVEDRYACSGRPSVGPVRYAVRSSACMECPLKSKCTNSPKGRW